MTPSISAYLKQTFLPTAQASIEFDAMEQCLSKNVNEELVNAFKETRQAMIGSWWDLLRSAEENNWAVEKLTWYAGVLQEVSQLCQNGLKLVNPADDSARIENQITKRISLYKIGLSETEIVRRAFKRVADQLEAEKTRVEQKKEEMLFERSRLYSPLLCSLYSLIAVAASVSVYLIGGG